MYKFTDYHYGADAGSNRSMPLVNFIIEESDILQIQQQLMGAMDDSGELPSNPFIISLIEPVSEEQVELSINPFEYLTEDDCRNYLTIFGSSS